LIEQNRADFRIFHVDVKRRLDLDGDCRRRRGRVAEGGGLLIRFWPSRPVLSRPT
jgi:hypothetical protein